MGLIIFIGFCMVAVVLSDIHSALERIAANLYEDNARKRIDD